MDGGIQVLLVEDNPAEVRLTREAFAESKVPHTLFVVTDGEQASEYLFRRGRFLEVGQPDLILLDLNLPKKNGCEVLREIKASPDLAMIHVIVVTNSQSPDDVERVYRLFANCYLVKPPDIDDFFEMVKRIVEFWWQTAMLPNGRNGLLPKKGTL